MSLSQTNVSGDRQQESSNGEKDDTLYYIEENKAGKFSIEATHLDFNFDEVW